MTKLQTDTNGHKKVVDEESYTAASVFPYKLLHNEIIKDSKIKPIHVQLTPTNKCNLNCEFCSCAGVDRTKEIDYETIKNILLICRNKGTEAVTITGGGEPLVYDKFNELIDYCDLLGLKVGFVTNGILLDRLRPHSNLVWVRVSSSDDRKPAFEAIKKGISSNPDISWSFSHVVTAQPNYSTMKEVINFANEHKFTHIRFTTNLVDAKNCPNMDEVKANMKGVDDNLVIYQDRKDKAVRGMKCCNMSLLKPYIAPEGIFPCCGAQYAISNSNLKRGLFDNMKSCELKDLSSFFDKQIPFDGSKCNTCYYSLYNEMLLKFKRIPTHKEFI